MEQLGQTSVWYVEVKILKLSRPTKKARITNCVHRMRQSAVHLESNSSDALLGLTKTPSLKFKKLPRTGDKDKITDYFDLRTCSRSIVHALFPTSTKYNYIQQTTIDEEQMFNETLKE